MSGKTADVIIIGSGITGNAAAYYLSKKKISSIVLESDDIIGNGASSRNGGCVRASGRDAKETAMARYATEHIWPVLSDELDEDVEYERGGLLRFARGGEQVRDLEKLCQVSRDGGLCIDIIYGGKNVHAFSGYCADNIDAAAWCPTDGHANPLRTTLAFYTAARRNGVKFYSGERVTKLGTRRGRVSQVFTESGAVYEGNKVILAAGFGSRAVADSVGIEIPMRRRLVEVMITEQAPPMFSFVYAAPYGIYGHKTKHGSFVVGGNSPYDHFPLLADNYRTNQTFSPSVCRGTVSYLPKFAELKIIRTWAGVIDFCMDEVPVFGPVEEAENLFVAAAYSGHGFCLGPVSGKILSELVNGEETCADWTPLRYNRFKTYQ